MLNTALITVDSYRFELKPFAYKLSIEGRIELSSKYQLGAELLVGKVTLPNQVIELIDLIPETKEACYKKTSHNCQVFKFSSFIQLSGDKYFSREFDQPENVPLQFSFDLNTKNIQSFRSYNRYSLKGETELSDFISNVKLLNIRKYFNYQNSFNVERKHSWDTSKTIRLPVSWTLSNKKNNIQYEQVNIKLKNHDYSTGYYIKEWFTIDTKAKTQVDQTYITFEDGSSLEIPRTAFDSYLRTYYLNGAVKRIKNQYRYEQDNRNSGIFFPEKTSGTLVSKLRLLHNNHAYSITIKNPFSFNNHYLVDKTKNLKIWIRPIYIRDFSRLRRYKFLTI